MTSINNGARVVTRKQTPTTDGWRASSTVPLIPTLVIFPDDFPQPEVVALQVGVKRRLTGSVFSDLLKWEIVPFSEENSGAVVQKLVDPFLDFGFWRRLQSQGLVNSIPAGDEPPPLRIILICDVDRMAGLAAETIQNIFQIIQIAAKGSNLIPVLIAIGDSKLDANKVAGFWPRIRLRLGEAGTVQSKRERMNEVLQTIVTLLVSSELNRAIEEGVGLRKLSTGWIVTGASCILTDTRSMREMFELLMWRHLYETVTGGTSLKKAQINIDKIASESKNQVKSYRDELVKRMLTLSMNLTTGGEPCGWAYKLDDSDNNIEKDRQQISTFQPAPNSNLPKRLVNPSRDLPDFLFGQYQEWDHALGNILTELRKLEYPKLLSKINQWFDAADKNLFPFGLPSAIRAAEFLQTELTKDEDIYFKGKPVAPFFLSGDYPLLASAYSDADFLLDEHRRYKRFIRQIFSPAGLIIRVISSWPLLTIIFLNLTRWTEFQSVLIAGMVVLVISGIQWVLWRNQGIKMLADIRKQMEERIASTMLRIAAGVAKEYRLTLVARIKEIATQLNLANAFVLGIGKEVEGSLAALAAQAAPKQELQTIIKLSEPEKSKRWASKAIEYLESSEDASAMSAIMEKYLQSVLRDNASPRVILFHLKAVMINVELREFRTEQLQVYDMANQFPQLEKGKKWHWLYEGAQPLVGSGISFRPVFTLISLSDDAALIGAFGKSSNFWGKDWLPIRSALSNELCCLRGFIEEEEYAQ